MLRRNPRSVFVGGAYVFPGGAVEPDDGGEAAQDCCTGRTDDDASRLLGIASGGLAYWVAAVRECFEEAGILLAYTGRPAADGNASADRPAADGRASADWPGADGHVSADWNGGGTLLSLADADTAARFVAHRGDVNGRRRRFLDVCRDERLRLATDRVHYFAHWITPEGAPRRFDTRFFVAATPPGQAATHDAGETVADEWVRPADALDRHRRGEIEMMPPTVISLQDIGRFATTDALTAAVAAAGRVATVEPKIIMEGRGSRIVLPGDPGYDEGPAVSAVDPADGFDFDDVARATARALNTAPPAGGG